ncbi:hypothetical protein BT96DRAFT_837684, partial [Gymnopus androsaceus JB14]
KWEDGRFIEKSLKSLGLPIVLMHHSLACPAPRPCHKQFRVLHTNGIHDVQLFFCGCERGEKVDDHIQLLRKGYYPSSQGRGRIKTVATFCYLELLHHLMLTTKASTYDFYRGLCKVTDASGLSKHPWRYRALVRMVLQWRHLKLLKWCGRGHNPSGVAGTADGELVVRCPSCPHPGINLPKGWESDQKNADLYALRVAMDANFRLKEQLVSSHSRDPGLNDGKGYFVRREPYEKYVLSLAHEEDISTCVGFQAIIKATTRFSKGLRYTGVGAVGCARGEMWLPNGAGSLHKGERYANMDYVFASVLRQYLGIVLIIVGYDIVCQWFIHLFARIKNQWPEGLRPPEGTTFIPVIGKFHEPAHKTKNHQQFCANLILLMGLSDWELLERLWGVHNVLGNATKTMGPGTRIDVLEAHFGFHNWEKYTGHGTTLWQKYKDGLRDRNRQREAHEGFTNALPEELVRKWEELFQKWEDTPHPKDENNNPWDTSEEFLSEAEVEKELAAEDAQRLRNSGRDPLHKTRAAKFLKYALDIEENHIKGVEELRAIYMPGLLQLLTDKQLPTAHESDSAPEEAKIWFPSCLTAVERDRVCTEGLYDMEIRLRQARCYDALQGLRHTLRVKTRMLLFKHANIRGQRDSGRSRDIIDGIHERAKGWAERYRRNRAALLTLLGPGNWEKELQPLRNADVRSYTDVEKKKGPGRRGTNEEGLGEGPGRGKEEEINLLTEERGRRDGTGQSRRVMSWIWQTTSVNVQDGADKDNELLRVEWGRSRARLARALEEVRYAREDMRRTVEFMECKAEWWVERADWRKVEDEALREGLNAYALKQASIQRQLKEMCITIWKKPLDGSEHMEDAGDTDLRMMLGVSTAPDEEEREEEEDDEEDEGNDGGLDGEDDEDEDLGWA